MPQGHCCLPHGETGPGHNSRRGFLRLAALAGGAALLTPMLSRPAQAAGTVEALLLTCMDYRLTDDVARYMDGRGLTGQYDHVILAGASLGALTDKRPDWGSVFWDHVQVARDLHHIRRVMIMDHRDCGAYKVFLGADVAGDRAAETALHAQQLRKLGAMVRQRHPDLAVDLMLMALDGSVELIPLQG